MRDIFSYQNDKTGTLTTIQFGPEPPKYLNGVLYMWFDIVFSNMRRDFLSEFSMTFKIEEKEIELHYFPIDKDSEYVGLKAFIDSLDPVTIYHLFDQASRYYAEIANKSKLDDLMEFKYDLVIKKVFYDLERYGGKYD